MKVKYIGDPEEVRRGQTLTNLDGKAFGKVFPFREPVDVSDLSGIQREKLLGNSHFAVVDDAPTPKPDEKPAEEAKAADEPKDAAKQKKSAKPAEEA